MNACKIGKLIEASTQYFKRYVVIHYFSGSFTIKEHIWIQSVKVSYCISFITLTSPSFGF